VLQDENSTNISGYIICRRNAKTCHILNLCIHSAFQNKGYGYFLLNATLGTLVTASMDTILLEVRVSNKPAIQLYEKLGFAVIETKKGYYVDEDGTEDAYQLGKFI
jgi:ribosomal-protein-alanine N-acetyltransferase